MKKLLIAIAAVMITASSYGQGQVVFSNRVGAEGIDLPFVIAGTGEGPGPAYSAQLYLDAGGSLTPLTPVTTFQDGTGAQAVRRKYLVSVPVDVTGATPGQAAQFRIRVWETAAGSYDASVNSRVEVGPFTATPQAAPNTPGNLVGLTQIAAQFPNGVPVPVVPEPSVIALGVLGAAALLIRRRK